MKDSKHQDIRVNSDGDIAQLADMFRLMGDPSRLRIILTCLHDPISVTEIAEQLELSQSLVSHHLRLLRAARVVASERRGKQIFYVAADEHIQCVIEDMVAHVSEPSQFEGDA
jgi:DNA-binding transcriptional ArsR family regulator